MWKLFHVSGAVVYLSPTAPGGELDLTSQAPYLDAARQPQDPTQTLVGLMGQLETIENRRAAFAWIVATSRRPVIEAPAALYAFVRAGVTDAALMMQAATGGIKAAFVQIFIGASVQSFKINGIVFGTSDHDDGCLHAGLCQGRN
jgi:hypothetical protein